ncbi:MAG: radical SAM protein, partial [Candidatus Omnitrophota bacterium]
MAALNNQVLDKKKLLVAGGILHSARAFIGPDVLHIDLTNLCNFNCIACWCRSPLLFEKAMPEWERKLTLSFDLLKGVFDDLSRMGGLRHVKLVGGGEPFLHPDILKIISYIKKIDRAIQIDINTNFSLVDEKTAQELIQLGVDSFTVSLWAGTPVVYAAVHPNQTEDTFHKIRSVLKYVADRKKELKLSAPRVILHDVIFNLNYQDVEEMVKFGIEVGANAVQFVPMDPCKGKTDALIFDQEQRKDLIERLRRIEKEYDHSRIELSDLRGFIRRLESLDTQTGAYDEKAVEEIPCYVGWLFSRIMAT